MRDSQRLNALHPFPTVVYAVSLALSVSYQQLRFSRLPSEREDAHEDFDAACGILQILRQKWASADVVAALSRRISTGLATLCNLDVLHVSRGRINCESANVAQYRRQQGPEARTDEHANIAVTQQQLHDEVDSDTNQSAACREPWGPVPAMFDIFSDMDDMSWAYLEVGNPVGFDVALQNLPT